MINAALDLYFVYQDNRRASIEVQREKADAAAAEDRIVRAARSSARSAGWPTPSSTALPADQRRFDYVRLLRQVPAITELAQLDRTGHEQLHVSRLSMDVVGSGTDRSTDPPSSRPRPTRSISARSISARAASPISPWRWRTAARGGVTVADVNLKLIWDVISQIKIGQNGYAYVVDRQGRLVAHPDISLVLRGTDMSRARPGRGRRCKRRRRAGERGTAVDARNRNGVPVLSAHAAIQR